MYVPKSASEMPEEIFQVPPSFLNLISALYSENDPNHYNEIISNSENIYYLLELIRKSFFMENDDLKRVLLTNLYLLEQMINRHIKEIQNDRNFKIFHFIDYLLPYAAQIYKNNCDIRFFKVLLRILTLINFEWNYCFSNWFDSYIIEMLEDQKQRDMPKAIISLFLCNKLMDRNVSKESFTLLASAAFNLIELLPNCVERSEYDVLLFKLIFKKSKFFLVEEIRTNVEQMTKIMTILNAFLANFINNCDKNLHKNTEIMKYVLVYLNILSSYSNVNAELVVGIYNSFYRNLIVLNEVSQFLISRELIEYIYKNIRLLQFNVNNQVELDYFASLIYNFSKLTKSGIEDALDSQENFFFDNYDFEFNDDQMYTTREIVVKLLLMAYKGDNTEVFIVNLLQKIFQTNPQNFDEINMFILSQMNSILFRPQIIIEDGKIEVLESDEKRQNFKNLMQTNLLNIIPTLSSCANVILSKPQSLNNANEIASLFSYLYLISTSFPLLPDDIIINFNNEISKILNVITFNDGAYFSSTFYTFLCMISCNLLERDKLANVEQICHFIVEKGQFCLTNHANDFFNVFAQKYQNMDCLLKSFENYLTRALKILNDFYSDEKIEVLPNGVFYFEDTRIVNSKSYKYSIKLFERSIEKMLPTISIFPQFPFYEAQLLNLIKLMIYYEDEWDLRLECIQLVLMIFEKVPDVKKWIEAYFTFIKDADRISDYGEWVEPVVILVSNRPDSIDQEICNFILGFMNSLIEEKIIGDDYYIEDLTMFFSLAIRLFGLSYVKQVSIPQQAMLSYFKLINNYIENNGRDEIVIINEILLTSSAILAGLEYKEPITDFINRIIQMECTVSNEMRFMIIFLINNFIPENERPKFVQIMQECLDNSISKGKKFENAYLSNRKYFFSNIAHPIMNYKKLDNFIFE